MAVKSLIISSGLAALAAGVATLALPGVASAQERHWGNHGNGQAQGQGQAQTQAQGQVQVQAQSQSNAGNWQHRGNGEVRGNGGNWQGRGNGGNWTPGRPQGQVQVAPQVQATPQVQRNWNGGSNWRHNQVQQGQTYTPQNRVQGYTGQNHWNGQNRTYNQGTVTPYNGTRYNGTRTWSGRTGNYAGNWNRNWRGNDRYNWQSYRYTNRNVYHLGRYYSPYNNWSYRRFGIGFFLQPLFYGSNYWIDDPYMYRLPEAYGPYRWVRYYNDALLVDIYSGEVVDAIYDFFW